MESQTEAMSESSSVTVREFEVEIETTDDNDKPSGARYSLFDITNYLSSGTYPTNADKATKCSLRKRSKFFIVEGGHLHYVGGKFKKSPRLVVQNRDEQQRLIKTVHDMAHLGRDKTLSQLSEHYYWPDMYKQVCTYVSSTIIHK